MGGLAPCTLGHVDAVECADELLCEFPPLFKRPSPALGGVGGKFNPYHVPHQRSSAVNFLGKHLLEKEHPLIHGIRRYVVGQVVEGLLDRVENIDEVKSYIEETKKKNDMDRTELNKGKSGCELKGVTCINPVNGKEVRMSLQRNFSQICLLKRNLNAEV